MLFHFVAFPYMHYSQSYRASNTKGLSLEKFVQACWGCVKHDEGGLTQQFFLHDVITRQLGLP